MRSKRKAPKKKQPVAPEEQTRRLEQALQLRDRPAQRDRIVGSRTFDDRLPKLMDNLRDATDLSPYRDAKTLDALLDRATDVIGDRAAAARWLGTPVKALGYRTPIDVAVSEGSEKVVIVLDRVEHGVW